MNQQTKTIYVKDYTPPDFLIDTAVLHFHLDPAATTVVAQLSVKRNHPKPLACPIGTTATVATNLFLNGNNLQLQTLALNGKGLTTSDYKLDEESLTIFNVPDEFTLDITTVISPKNNHSCSGLYLTNNNYCTQCEPQGFQQLTYFIDRPDVLTKFTATIVAPKDSCPTLLANGNLIATNELPDGWHSATWQDPHPKSAYLFALVAGKFSYIEDYFLTRSNRRVTLRIYAEPEQLNQCHHAMAALKQAMSWDEKNFSCEYDLDNYMVVAINDLNIGAMENKGLNVFNSSLLFATPQSATDADYTRIASVVAHEYFHNWTGNRITCRDWFQIGLKEGLTTLREQLFTEEYYGQATSKIANINYLRTRQFPEDAGPLSHPVRLQSYIEINNFYTATIYHKSAEIARMLLTFFGPAAFRNIMEKFFQHFDGQAVTIEDFLTIATQITKADLEQFKLWYDRAGTPEIAVTTNFDPAKQTYQLTIKQLTDQPYNFPLAVALFNNEGQLIREQIVNVQQTTEELNYQNIPTKPVVSLLRDFSAPVKIDYQQDDRSLLLLLQHEPDPFSRWDASQQLLLKIMLQLISDYHNTSNHITIPAIIINAFKAILTDTTIAPEFAAQLLQLPSESYIHTFLTPINVAAVHSTSEQIKLVIANELASELLTCYHKCHSSKPYELSAAAIGARSLKNICLNYLMHRNDEVAIALALTQLQSADNLTDLLGSLIPLVNSNYSEREQLLEKHYQKWQHEPNLVNKWLAINANVKFPNTLQRVQQLLQHPGFNYTTPNKVFALIRTFCENNHINFHQADGTGYQFLADQILHIDQFNPQLAALIATPLTRGYKLDPARKQLMQAQVQRILTTPKLSKNVYEICARAE